MGLANTEPGSCADLNMPRWYNATLFATDYDGTTNITSEPSSRIVDVNQAYAIGLADVLDEEAAATFSAQGGHKNRTPIEIIEALRPHLDYSTLGRLANTLSEVKLDILIGQIGTELEDGSRWPRPTDGYVEFWTQLNEAMASGAAISTAIISAGHTRFIERSFDYFGLPQPQCMITEDVLRGLRLTVPLRHQAKPQPLPLELAKQVLRIAQSRLFARVIYTGDDPVKDGGLATNAGAEFVLIDKSNARAGWREVSESLGLSAISNLRTGTNG